MEPLREGEHELCHEYSAASGYEKQFVWNSLLDEAYTKLEDMKTGERINIYAREGTHPKQTFERPFTQYVLHLGDEALQPTVAFEPLTEEGMGTE